MVKKLKRLALIFSILGITIILSACGSKFAEGEAHYYSLSYISGGDPLEDIQLYIVDPFDKEVYASSQKTNEKDWLYDLEEYEDEEDMLTFKYNGVTEKLEKKSDSLWRSLETSVEYDVKKYTEKPDYQNR